MFGAGDWVFCKVIFVRNFNINLIINMFKSLKIKFLKKNVTFLPSKLFYIIEGVFIRPIN